MRLASPRSLLLLLVAVAAIAWLLMANRPSVEPGLRADIDPAPFHDSTRDAVAPAGVIRLSASGTGAGQPPNIVLILADDHG
jgi:hypothetical protein